MRSLFSSLALAALIFNGCASGNNAVATHSADATAQSQSRKSKRPETENIGPDVIVGLSAEEIWPYLSKVEDWGSWCPKVTKVEPGAGLSPGAEIKWQWEEKEVDSTIMAVTENQEFDFKSCASSKKAVIKWRLQSRHDGSTLISLRAEVPYGTASETMDKLGQELNDWIVALQTIANKQ